MRRIRQIVRKRALDVNYLSFQHITRRRLPALCPTLPMNLQIETSQKCNLKCTTCEYSYFAGAGRRMSLANFRKILRQFPLGQHLDMTGIGESLMNRDFAEMLAYAKQRGLSCGFTTNGTLLDRKWADVLVDLGVDFVSFSLDGASKESYEAVRRGATFEKVLANISYLASHPCRLTQGRPQVSLNMTLTRSTVFETEDYLRLARKLGVPRVVFRDLVSFPGGKLGRGEAAWAVREDVRMGIREKLEHLGQKLHLQVELSPSLEFSARREGTICLRPWRSCYVSAEGDFYACCMVRQRGFADKKKFSFGNLLEKDFNLMWNSAKARRFRGRLARGPEVPELCQGCYFLRGLH